jgi:hypothetical protein
MQTTFSGHTAAPVPNSVRLNCTANDISLSDTEMVSPTTCIEGETFDLTASFRVNVTANSRYDAAFHFNTSGGDNARLGTTCSLSVLDPDLDPGLQLDGDTCGDLNSGTYSDTLPGAVGTAVTFTIPDVLCQAAAGTNLLRLPYCTAWHSNQGTLCTQADAGAPGPNSQNVAPDTKSKCVCNDNFTVPVIVESATLDVTKTATPDEVPETGGAVSYAVTVTNNSQFVDVTITTIEDDLYGDLTQISACGTGEPDAVTPGPCTPSGATSCPSLVDVVLQENGGTASCTFAAFVSGDFGETVTDVAEVCGTQQGTGAEVCDEDDADVDITDVPSNPTLSKSAQSASCDVDVSYQVVVSNPGSNVDTLTLNDSGLDDDQFGDITMVHGVGAEGSCSLTGNDLNACKEVVSTTCGQAAGAGTLPQDLIPGSNYTCTFVGRIADPDCTFTHTNTVTGDLTDDDNMDYSPSDDATVTVTGPTFD